MTDLNPAPSQDVINTSNTVITLSDTFQSACASAKIALDAAYQTADEVCAAAKAEADAVFNAAVANPKSGLNDAVSTLEGFGAMVVRDVTGFVTGIYHKLF